MSQKAIFKFEHHRSHTPKINNNRCFKLLHSYILGNPQFYETSRQSRSGSEHVIRREHIPEICFPSSTPPLLFTRKEARPYQDSANTLMSHRERKSQLCETPKANGGWGCANSEEVRKFDFEYVSVEVAF